MTDYYIAESVRPDGREESARGEGECLRPFSEKSRLRKRGSGAAFDPDGLGSGEAGRVAPPISIGVAGYSGIAPERTYALFATTTGAIWSAQQPSPE